MKEVKTPPISSKTLIISLLIVTSIASLGYFLFTTNEEESVDNREERNEIENGVETSDTMEEIVVIFEDENLENYVREELNIQDGDITSVDMLDLYSLNISEIGVENLTGLEYALELNTFSLSRENINSLEPIKNLHNLEYFFIRYSEIENLPIEFSEEVNFTNFTIVNTQINDISFLSHMTNLEHLTVTDAGLTDISSIKNLNNLNQVNFRGNEIEDISALEGKNQLEILNLQSNKVSDISPLADLEKLDDLVLSFNPAYNLKAIESLPSLSVLVIHLGHEVKHLIFDQVEVLKNMGIDVEYNR